MHADPKLVAVANREVVLANFVPYSTHVTDQVIRTREGTTCVSGRSLASHSRRLTLPRSSRAMRDLISWCGGWPAGTWAFGHTDCAGASRITSRRRMPTGSASNWRLVITRALPGTG